jgi:hypothetical protein
MTAAALQIRPNRQAPPARCRESVDWCAKQVDVDLQARRELPILSGSQLLAEDHMHARPAVHEGLTMPATPERRTHARPIKVVRVNHLYMPSVPE